MIVNEEIISQIKQGYCVLLGIHRDDTKDDIDRTCQKLLNIRLFNDDSLVENNSSLSGESNNATKTSWNRTIKDLDGEILCVSQFTLYGTVQKSNKPEFHHAMKTEDALKMYNIFLDTLKKLYIPERVAQGKFGHMMKVQIVNDGPVTIIYDTRQSKK